MSYFGDIKRPIFKRPYKQRTRAKRDPYVLTSKYCNPVPIPFPVLKKDSYWLDLGDARKLPTLVTTNYDIVKELGG